MRPPLDALRVTPERSAHILDGEPGDGGGHRHGVGSPGTALPEAMDMPTDPIGKLNVQG
jgi:hypothetical protein